MANTAADTAANLGYSMAFFQSDPELKKLLDKAVSGNWTPAQFVAKLQATTWFKKNGEAARQIYALKTSDPATYKQRYDSAVRQVTQLAYQVGGSMEGGAANKLAEQALTFGWTDDQIKRAIEPYIKAGSDGLFKGGAGGVQMQLRELVSQYGYSPTTDQMGRWVRQVVQGRTNIEQIRQYMMNAASSKFPALKERLQTGETLEDIVAPYKDSYSRVLEVNPKNISVRDKQIEKALSTKGQDGKPAAMSVWEFENTLREDPRWLKTKNAQDQLVGETHKALASFGLMN